LLVLQQQINTVYGQYQHIRSAADDERATTSFEKNEKRCLSRLRVCHSSSLVGCRTMRSS